jgi:hypothetical protein
MNCDLIGCFVGGEEEEEVEMQLTNSISNQ